MKDSPSLRSPYALEKTRRRVDAKFPGANRGWNLGRSEAAVMGEKPPKTKGETRFAATGNPEAKVQRKFQSAFRDFR